MENVCKPLGLAGNLKVKLESGVYNQWDDNQVLRGSPVLFNRQGVIKSSHVSGSVSCMNKGGLLMVIRMKKVRKPSLKCFDSAKENKGAGGGQNIAFRFK